MVETLNIIIAPSGEAGSSSPRPRLPLPGHACPRFSTFFSPRSEFAGLREPVSICLLIRVYSCIFFSFATSQRQTKTLIGYPSRSSARTHSHGHALRAHRRTYTHTHTHHLAISSLLGSFGSRMRTCCPVGHMDPAPSLQPTSWLSF